MYNPTNAMTSLTKIAYGRINMEMFMWELSSPIIRLYSSISASPPNGKKCNAGQMAFFRILRKSVVANANSNPIATAYSCICSHGPNLSGGILNGSWP